jgi:hypothetical protein
MVRLTITGRARFVEDPIEKKRVWEGKIFDYELGVLAAGSCLEGFRVAAD